VEEHEGEEDDEEYTGSWEEEEEEEETEDDEDEEDGRPARNFVPITGYENAEPPAAAPGPDPRQRTPPGPAVTLREGWRRMYESSEDEEEEENGGRRRHRRRTLDIPSGVKKRRAILAYQYGVCFSENFNFN
jgi:hypothetical protein